MRKLIIPLLALLLGNQLSAFTPRFNLGKLKVKRFEHFQEQAIALPTTFANWNMFPEEVQKQIQGKHIYHVDLVYTAFKQAPDFDQNELNNSRVQTLITALPQLSEDRPSWRMIEQTGATSVNEARGYFHGFILHYSSELEHDDLRSFMQNIGPKFEQYDVDNDQSQVIKRKDGSMIRVPKGAVVNQNGTPVDGPYQLMYREYRDHADIAFSGIPMNYKNVEGDHNFSSVGMFEMRAYQNGKPLKMNTPMTVDFNCTKVDDGVGYYAMNDDDGSWKKIKDIEFAADNIALEDGQVNGDDIDFWQLFDDRVGRRPILHECKCDADEKTLMMNGTAWEVYSTVKDKKPERFNNAVIEDNEEKRSVNIANKNVASFKNTVLAAHAQAREAQRKAFVLAMGKEAIVIGGRRRKRAGNNDRRAGSLLASGADAGHTYPTLVKGLNCPEFGVYNCDQIYRIANKTTLSPKYVDAGTGKAIENQHVICVLDMCYNGSFSFHPNAVTCNADGENAFLLFTKDERVFMMEPGEFRSVDLAVKQGTHFPMRDVTETIKTPKDLKKVLGI